MGFEMERICAGVPCVDYPRGREREGDKQKSTITTEYQKIEKKGYVCVRF